MSVVLELPAELETELAAEASQLGVPLSEYVVRLLSQGRAAQSPPKTGAELVAYWEKEGLIGTRPDITDSQAHARSVRAKAEKRMRS